MERRKKRGNDMLDWILSIEWDAEIFLDSPDYLLICNIGCPKRNV